MQLWRSGCMRPVSSGFRNFLRGRKDNGQHPEERAKESLMSYVTQIPHVWLGKSPIIFLFCLFTIIKLHNHSKTLQNIIFESKKCNRLHNHVLFYDAWDSSTGLGVLRILHSPIMNHSCCCVCVCVLYMENKICALKAADDLLQQNICITSLEPQHWGKCKKIREKKRKRKCK